uniref:SWIM-type domain-containing protein n=1 Tax=Parascaris univalens TaxID=6257 RepID=A0A914ZVQ1_PARUN
MESKSTRNTSTTLRFDEAQMTTSKDRLHYDIGLTSLQKDTDATTCRHRGSVAVITYNQEGLVCRRNFTTGRKCVLRSGRVICCCIEEEECRQLESSVWGLMNAIQYIERRY